MAEIRFESSVGEFHISEGKSRRPLVVLPKHFSIDGMTSRDYKRRGGKKEVFIEPSDRPYKVMVNGVQRFDLTVRRDGEVAVARC